MLGSPHGCRHSGGLHPHRGSKISSAGAEHLEPGTVSRRDRMDVEKRTGRLEAERAPGRETPDRRDETRRQRRCQALPAWGSPMRSGSRPPVPAGRRRRGTCQNSVSGAVDPRPGRVFLLIDFVDALDRRSAALALSAGETLSLEVDIDHVGVGVFAASSRSSDAGRPGVVAAVGAGGQAG